MSKKKEEVKKEEVQIFYANKDKYLRASKEATKPSEIKKIYEKLGGQLQEGHGYMPV